MPEADDIVCVLPWSSIGGTEDDVMVWDLPGGGAAPKMFENAASR